MMTLDFLSFLFPPPSPPRTRILGTPPDPPPGEMILGPDIPDEEEPNPRRVGSEKDDPAEPETTEFPEELLPPPPKTMILGPLSADTKKDGTTSCDNMRIIKQMSLKIGLRLLKLMTRRETRVTEDGMF